MAVGPTAVADGIMISQLPAAIQANDSDELEANQGGTSRKVTRAQILTDAHLTGTPTAPTIVTGSNTDQRIANVATLINQFNLIMPGYATINSPVFTGDPRAPTPATGDNDTSIATTAFVKAQGYATLAYVDAADALRAPLASPTFTGDPKAPTPATADNDTSIATTAFVKAQAYAPLASPTFTGTPTVPTPAALNSSSQIANTFWVQGELVLKASLASPTFTGVPAAPTAAPGTNTTQLATTAFTTAAVAAAPYAPLASPTFTGDPKAPTPSVSDNDTSIATTAHVVNVLNAAAFAPLASPTFTGVPAAPTAAPGTSTTQIATTAFVAAAVPVLAAPFMVVGNAGDTLSGPGSLNLFRAGFMAGTKIYDPGNVIDLANNARFVAPSAGFYHFDLHAFTGMSAAGQVAIFLLHQTSAGATIRNWGAAQVCDATGYGSAHALSIDIPMSAGERIQTAIATSASVTVTIAPTGGVVGGIASGPLTFFSGYKVG